MLTRLLSFSLFALLFTITLPADVTEDDVISRRVEQNGIVQRTTGVTIYYERDGVDARTLSEFSKLAEQGLADIETFTGMKRSSTAPVRIYVAEDIGISHTYPQYPTSAAHEPRVFLDAERVRDRTAPYLHELVHTVAGEGGEMWLEEGFASYVASEVARKYGGYYAPVLSESNERVDAQAREEIAETSHRDLDRTLAFIGDHRPRFRNQNDRQRFYVLSHSFTKFLAAKLGLQRLIAVHMARGQHALGHAGAETARWKAEWWSQLTKS